MAVVAFAVTLSACNCSGRIKIDGSSCTAPDDCGQYPSCGLRSGGCACQGGACYYDPNAPISNVPGCRSCHGSLDNAAPPRSVDGGTETTLVEVGAHQRHLSGGAFSRPVACSECHVVPQTVDEPGHQDHAPPAIVTFGALASADGGSPTWDRSTTSCSTYCHGATLSGGTLTTPNWIQVDGTQAPCGSCHGLPPLGNHPGSNQCEQCHSPTAGPNQTIANRNTHIDGVVQGGGGSCDSCHGDPARPPPSNVAPPLDLAGAQTSSKVGAHLEHLGAAGSVDVACDNCHRVPADFSSPGHVSDADRTAEVLFFGLAVAADGGTPPSYSSAALSCANTYCHGATLTGGTLPASGPAWTAGAAGSACNSCHGNPPPAPHPQIDTCDNCHPGYAKTGATTGTTVKATHVDGVIDTNVSCSSCHGTSGRDGGSDPFFEAAPPLGTLGETATTTRAVGAHMAHLTPGPYSDGFSCQSCHLLPGGQLHSDGAATVTFGGLATSGTANPTWNGATCAGSYCHGKFKNGNAANAPVWIGTNQADCGSCHGTPANPSPAGTHPASAANSCANCHPNYTGTTVDKSVHINGVIDVINLTCQSCHGDEARASVPGADPDQQASPPLDTNGLSAATSLGVGAHLSHVNPGAGAVASPFTCPDCHGPTPISTSHADNVVQISFGALAQSQASAPTWTRATATCAGSWCHGGNALLRGGTRISIVWNNGTTTNCTSCHGNPPPLPHSQSTPCTPCHSAAYTRTSATTGTVDMALHLNGVIDTTGLSCTTCHGNAARASVAGADANQASAPPVDSLGNSLPTALGVGVHLGHVNPGAGALSQPLACAECHGPPPTSNIHYDGTVQMAFGPIAGAQLSTPTWTRAAATCAGTWCHGDNARLLGGTDTNPVWNNNSTVDCTSCHGNPPPDPHSQNLVCSNCHSDSYTRTGPTTGTVDLALHINGLIDVTNLSCISCHGDGSRISMPGADPDQMAAPPVDVAGNFLPDALGVGAHEIHVNPDATALAAPFGCPQCHGPTPTSTSHSDSVVQMPFGSLAKAQGSTPTWTRATATCANAWCHGGNAKLVGGNLTSIVWNTGIVVDCISCHGNPPPPPHPQNDTCNSCHPAAYSKSGPTSGTVDLALHVDGLIDVSNLTCQSCHGDDTRTSIPGADPNQKSAPPMDTTGSLSSTSLGVGEHFAHVNLGVGAVARPFTCDDCHGSTPSSTSHADSAVQMTFGSLAGSQGSTPTWTRGTATCSNVWCHGGNSKLLGGTQTTIIWNNNTVTDCTSCHGNPPPAPHAANDACGTCHATAYTKTGPTTGTVDMSEHVNGLIDVTNLNCQSCHGDGGRNSVAGADPNQKSSPPVDTAGNTASTALGVGAHLAHVNHGAGAMANPFTCPDCHGTTPTSTSHSDSVVQISFGALASAHSSTPTWTRGTATCVSSWCHGGNPLLVGGTQTSIVWNNGTTANCRSCHGNPPPSPHVQNDACGTCHTGYSKTGATTGTVNVTTHVDGTIDYVPLTCATCHGTAGRTGADPNIAAAPPIGTAGETQSTTRAVGAHLAHMQGTTLRAPMACTECHLVPGANLHADGTAQVTFGTLAKTRGATPVWSGTGCATTYCHGNFTNGNTANTPVWTGGSTEDACGTCHGTLADPVPGGTHPAVAPTTSCGNCHAGYTRTTVDTSLHVNGVVDGGGEPATGGTSCGTCHSTQFAGMTGGAPKTSKHLLGGGDNPVDPGGAWTSPLKSAAPYASASCVSMCHGDHPHDLTSPTVSTHQNNVFLDASSRSATRTSSTRSAGDHDPAAANGGLCLSCHRFAIDATKPGLSIPNFRAGAHNYTSNAQGTWTYTLHDGSTYARNCTKCHADNNDGRPNDASGPLGAVHYSDYPTLLTGAINAAGAPATLVCNNCHGNGTVGSDYSGKVTATDFAKSQGHPVNADTRHSSVTEATLSYNDGKLSGVNRHVNCLDCHDPHEAGPTSHNRTATATSTRNQIGTGSPLRSVSGVNMTTLPGLWGTTGASNFTFLPVATAEYQICFKCHTSFAFGANPPNGPSGLVETDLGQAFNPNNRSGHPVMTGLASYGGSLAPKALATAQLVAPWNVNVGTQTMMCSDCHGSDSVAPAAQGPHGSASSFMLVGTNQNWPGTFTLGSMTSGLGTPAGLFCANCHPSSTSSNNTHSKSNHRGSRCTACHILIPHGGKVSRLIATNTAGLPARLKQVGVNVTVTQYRKASSRTGYQKSDCATSCSGHDPATGLETW